MESREEKKQELREDVLTPEKTPSYRFGLTIVSVLLAIALVVGAIYYNVIDL